MQDYEQQLERLKQALKVDSDTAFSQVMDISQGSVSGAKKRGQIPHSWFFQVAEKTGFSIDWLFWGDELGPPGKGLPTPLLASPLNMERVVPGPALQVVECQECEYTLVPLAKAVLSAGGGSFECGGASDERYAFRTDWLRRKGQPGKMVLMRVAGDSMEPEIKDKDLVLIDQSDKRLQPNSVYAVAVEDMVYLKQANAMPGKIILTSYNTLYSPIEVDTNGDLEDSVHIIGRVIWWCREA
ncbi:LexA family transcriptional regulator [Desulfovibrio cuneatus]|uniref:LexA family transcriptional regulator n=1 Tax=Desulfovibrio cuneatus TaxID=159728 RepID=UPI00041FA496|nr:S24 family peptidase [Desulfovibrio cuneatus]